MDIRSVLKQQNMKLGEFSELLDISRPTLNTYIQKFENNEKIENDKYNLIFSELFTKKMENENEFKNKVLSFSNLIKNDKKNGTFHYNPKATDLANKVIESLKKDIETNDFNENVYIFINMLINSYKHEKSFIKFINYILLLNGSMNKDSIKEDEKIYISNFYKLMFLEKQKKLVFEENYYKMFEKRIDQIQRKKEKIQDELKSKINKMIQTELEKKISEGTNINTLDKEELLKKIESDLDRFF